MLEKLKIFFQNGKNSEKQLKIWISPWYGILVNMVRMVSSLSWEIAEYFKE